MWYINTISITLELHKLLLNTQIEHFKNNAKLGDNFDFIPHIFFVATLVKSMITLHSNTALSNTRQMRICLYSKVNITTILSLSMVQKD